METRSNPKGRLPYPVVLASLWEVESMETNLQSSYKYVKKTSLPSGKWNQWKQSLLL